MGFLAQNLSPNVEEWELEEEAFLKSTLSKLSPGHRLAALLSIGMVTAVEVSNRIAVNVFLPDMQGNVGASSDEISWVIILYNVGYLCSLALAAWMTRVIGTRRHLLLSIGLYAVGSMGCVTAHSLHWLLISRLIMGFGGGAFLVRVVILSGMLFPGREKLAAVTRLYLLIAVFEVFYPVSTGWITDQVRWNYAFLIDFPFLAIGAFLIWKLIPPGYLFERKTGIHIDVWGAALLIASMACLQTALSRGERDLWFESHWILLAMIAAAIFLIAFVWWEFRPENTAPVLHLRMVWRQGSLRGAFFLVLIVGGFFGAGLYVTPQYLRFVQDYSATQAGGFISMYTLGLGAGIQISSALAHASPGTSPHVDNRICGFVRDISHDRLCHDAHDPDRTPGSHDFPARLLHRAHSHRGWEHCDGRCKSRGGERYFHFLFFRAAAWKYFCGHRSDSFIRPPHDLAFLATPRRGQPPGSHR